MIEGLKSAQKIFLDKEPLPGWMDDLRQPAFQKFESLGLPNLKDENWKYTSVRKLAKTDFSYSFEEPKVDQSILKEWVNENDLCLVFVDGIYSSQSSQTSKEVIVRDLAEAAKDSSSRLRFLLGDQSPSFSAESFYNLNQAFLGRGSYIELKEAQQVDQTIYLVYLNSGDSQPRANCIRNYLVAAKGSSARVCELHLGEGGESLKTINTEIVVEPKSRINYQRLQNESRDAYHIAFNRAHLHADSYLNYFSGDFGGNLVRNQFELNLVGKNAELILNGIYCVGQSQHCDNQTVIDHRVPECKSSQVYRGIAFDGGRAVFGGKVFVRKDAQQTAAHQSNKNLLLGDNAEIDTKPELQIDADDVKCSHGATVGRLDDDELFYLKSRSIPEKQAYEMLCRGFLADVYGELEDEALRAKLTKMLRRVLRDNL